MNTATTDGLAVRGGVKLSEGLGSMKKQQNGGAIETYDAAVFLLLIPVERLAVLKPRWIKIPSRGKSWARRER
jgi:hypothetical protein